MKFLIELWNYIRHYIWRRQNAAATKRYAAETESEFPIEEPDKALDDVVQLFEPNKTGRQMRYDEIERARKRRQKGAR